MEAGASVQLDNLADDSVATIMSFLPSDSILAASAAAARLVPTARADVLWLPRISRRWRFGAMPMSTEALLPGARSMAAESALAEAAQAPLHSQAGAFRFFAERCQRDVEVRLLALQLNEAVRHPEADAANNLPPGTVVRIVNLASTPQLNGALGVVGDRMSSGEERFAVTLPTSLRLLSIKGKNLEHCRPCPGEEEAQRRVVEAGAAAIDALARIAEITEAGSTLRRNVRFLLAEVTEQWAERQWRLLMADPGRTDLLEEGGLIVSQWAEPGTADVAAMRSRLAELASAVEARTTPAAPVRERVEAVNAVFFEEYRFAGDTENYYDPRNSFLHAVLERRRGIPISLSVVWAAVARRVEVPCFLLANMPSHLLIRVTMGGDGLRDDIFVDAFSGKIMDFGTFMRFTLSVAGTFDERFAAQVSASAVYARILRNLAHIYQEQAQHANTLPGRMSALHGLAGVCLQSLAILGTGRDSGMNGEVERLVSRREQVQSVLASLRGTGHGR